MNRLSKQFSIVVSPDVDVADGETFTLNDGYTNLKFEFDIRGLVTDPISVTPGNIPVPLILPYGTPANARW